MKLHPDEYDLARRYDNERAFEGLSADQMKRIMDRGRSLYHWYKNHSGFHNCISGVLVSGILVCDGCALFVAPALLLAGGRAQSYGWILLASLCAGGLHSWLMYSLALFSLHEGAAHNLIFSGTGPVAARAQFLAGNLCRLAAGEPDYYSRCHMAHHAKFGTEHDSEFLNFVIPHRFWLALLPWAAFVNFSDFLIHRPLTYTRGRLASALSSLLYNGTYSYFLYRRFSGMFVALTMLIFLPHVGFYMDRMRQFTEHNLMPLENRNGARNFGMGFWGLLIGGGPWGQPCHLAHHLMPSIPWYQQIRLHFFIRSLLTGRQREQFLLQPVVGFPRLLWAIVRGADRFAGAQRVLSRGAHGG